MPYVLFVDEEPQMRTLGTRLLHDQLGYEVRCAASAGEAFELAQSELPAAIVASVELPDRDGLWLVARLREHAPNLPVVLISASAEPLSGAGDTPCLAKPFSRAALSEALDRALAAVTQSVTRPQPSPGRPDRRQTPPCPNCGRQDILRIPETSQEPQLRWFKCLSCRHIWKKGPRASN
jgi:CheY-like chemotaxis protein